MKTDRLFRGRELSVRDILSIVISVSLIIWMSFVLSSKVAQS